MRFAVKAGYRANIIAPQDRPTKLCAHRWKDLSRELSALCHNLPLTS
jgi:hypothetical protein